MNWPEGAISRESIRAVRKLDRLKVVIVLLPLCFGVCNSYHFILYIYINSTGCSSLMMQDMLAQRVENCRSSLVDLLHGLLKYEPSERLTAQQALNHPFFQNPT